MASKSAKGIMHAEAIQRLDELSVLLADIVQFDGDMVAIRDVHSRDPELREIFRLQAIADNLQAVADGLQVSQTVTVTDDTTELPVVKTEWEHQDDDLPSLGSFEDEPKDTFEQADTMPSLGSLEDSTIETLRELARQYDINLSGATRKRDIYEVIQAAIEGN